MDDDDHPDAGKGGDPACWAHLFEDDSSSEPGHGSAVRVDLSTLTPTPGPGVRWSLPHGGDLDANLVQLGPGDEIGEHVNDEVDVLVIGRAGAGEVTVDGRRLALDPSVVVSIPKGARRRITAHQDGLSYLSIHRHRPGLSIRPRPGSAGDSPSA